MHMVAAHVRFTATCTVHNEQACAEFAAQQVQEQLSKSARAAVSTLPRAPVGAEGRIVAVAVGTHGAGIFGWVVALHALPRGVEACQQQGTQH